MKKLKTLLMLVALLALTTQAWATEPTVYTTAVSRDDLNVGDILIGGATITVNELPVVALATPAAICDGQSTTVEVESVTGGATPYQYSWDGGATFGDTDSHDTGVLSDDANYSVIVRDANGCTASAETTVSVGENILPVFSSYEACNGDTQIVLPTESENGITGTWLPAAVDMTAPATYTFTPDAGFCALQTTVDVTIFDRPTATVTGSTAICADNTDGQ